MRVVHTEYWCPNCGQRTVYVDRDDSGDYYAGTSHYCVSCHHRLPDLDQGNYDVPWKHSEFGANPDDIRRYLEIRIGAALPASTDAETVRLEAALAEAASLRRKRAGS